MLSYLRQKLIINDPKMMRSQSVSKIEKDVQNDLTYMKVFVQPIGDINIFQKDREEVQEKRLPSQELRSTDLDQEIRKLLQHSPLKPIIDKFIIKSSSNNTAKIKLQATNENYLKLEILDQIISTIMKPYKSAGNDDVEVTELWTQIKDNIIDFSGFKQRKHRDEHINE